MVGSWVMNIGCGVGPSVVERVRVHFGLDSTNCGLYYKQACI